MKICASFIAYALFLQSCVAVHSSRDRKVLPVWDVCWPTSFEALSQHVLFVPKAMTENMPLRTGSVDGTLGRFAYAMSGTCEHTQGYAMSNTNTFKSRK